MGSNNNGIYTVRTIKSLGEEINMVTTLDQIRSHRRVTVLDVRGGWGLRRHINQLGIHPGDILTVLRHAAMGGPILIMIHGSQIAIGRGMASHISVEDAE